jgi:RNA polymerase sigma factor for flagellar operon FliA
MDATVANEQDKYIEQWRIYKRDKTIEARNEIVLQYIDLVKKIAYRYQGSCKNYAQLDDVINQGIIALIDAVERFDPEMGNKFETFASLKIKGGIIDFIRKQDWVPRSQRALAKELDEVYSQLYSDYGSEPEKEQVAEKMGISLDNLDKILLQRHNAIVLSFEEVVEEKMMTASSLIVNQYQSDSPDAGLLYEELQGKLAEAIDQLNEKERLVAYLPLLAHQLQICCIPQCLLFPL